MSQVQMPRGVRLVLLGLISGFLALLVALGAVVSKAEAGSACIHLDEALAKAKEGGRLAENPVVLADPSIIGSYLVMIFDDGTAALAHFLPNNGCMVQAFVGTEAQARATIAAAKLKGA